MTEEQSQLVLETLQKHTDEEVTEDISFEQLGFDSLDISSIQMELEEVFDIVITDSTMKNVRSFADIAILIKAEAI